jgi:hypothetical protein
VEESSGQLARIAVDLGTEDLDNANAGRKTRRWSPLRRKKPDFCALFAAEGLRQLETYLAKWAAYDDYLRAPPARPPRRTQARLIQARLSGHSGTLAQGRP